MDQQLLRDVVEQAGRAPSIHNTQPWRFVARGDTLELWTEPGRGLEVLDPTGRARHLSCGAALLHARVAAARAGHVAVVTTLPDRAQPDHLADLRLVAGDPPAGDRELGDAIAARRTSRAPFTARQLPAEVVAELRAAAEVEGCWIRIVEQPSDMVAIAVLMARADELETANPAYEEELRRWTGAGEDATEGVPGSAVPDIAPSQRGSNFRLRDFVADREDEPATGADESHPPAVERPLVAVLGTREDDITSWLAAGQAVGRLLLQATARGVAASPMTQPLEIPDTRLRLARELGLVGHPQMILRLGYAEANAQANVPRRSVEDLLTED